MHSVETRADARYAKCKNAVGKKSHKISSGT